jgi:hypothetical protein
VESGKTIMINLVDIIDHQGRRPPAWQRVLVKVEKGKILNSIDKWNDYYVFKVGESGDLDIQYQAPSDCKRDKETLTVWNTCMKSENAYHISGSEFQIGKKEFEIVCDRWLVTVTFTEHWTVPGLAFGEASIKGSRSFTQTLKAEVNRTRKGELTSYGRRIYEATKANLDLEDRFQQVTTHEGCKVVAGWHGEKHGTVGAEVRLQLTDSPKHLYLDSEVTENGPAWKTAFQWSGCSPYPDGACEMTDTLSEGVVNLGSEMFTDSGSGPLVFEEGQDVIRGERRWSELGTDAGFQPGGNVYASANCRDGDSTTPFTTIIYYGLFNADRVPASKSIKWEIRRPGATR